MNASSERDFDAFLTAHLPTLAGYARLLTGNRHDAEDLLAETLLAALHRWTQISAMDHRLAYVRTMVTTRHIDRHRRWHRRTEVLLDSPDVAIEDLSDDIADAVVDRGEIESLLRDLPARQRAALVLHFFCDLPYVDVGRELGLTPGGARTLTFRALAALRLTQPVRDIR